MIMCNYKVDVVKREKTNDYEANYNGVTAYGETVIDAINNAKKKWELMQECG